MKLSSCYSCRIAFNSAFKKKEQWTTDAAATFCTNLFPLIEFTNETQYQDVDSTKYTIAKNYVKRQKKDKQKIVFSRHRQLSLQKCAEKKHTSNAKYK
jgi:hypothetical protein